MTFCFAERLFGDHIKFIDFHYFISFNRLFVATEFAIVKMRSSRLDQLIAEGNKKAIPAKHVVNHLDEYLSACQLGITITALGIGMVGEKPLNLCCIHSLK